MLIAHVLGNVSCFLTRSADASDSNRGLFRYG
jgi:hypothetical protein